jgi:hypothetical protein
MSSTHSSIVSPGAIGRADPPMPVRTMPTDSSCTAARLGGVTPGSDVYAMYPSAHAT